MTDPQMQIEALSKSVNALDGARRVGFGRAFSAEGKLEEALRDLNVVRSEREIFRRATSWLYGFMHEYIHGVAAESARADLVALLGDPRRAVDISQSRRGAKAAQFAMVAAEMKLDSKLVQSAERLERLRSRVKSEHANEWRNARRSERRSLARRYGFVSEDEMIAWLDDVRGRRNVEAS